MALPESENLIGEWEAAVAEVEARESSGAPPAPTHEEKLAARDASGKFTKADKAEPQTEGDAPQAKAKPPETPAKPAKVLEGAPKKPDVPERDGGDAAGEPTSLAQLQELAKKHGFVIEDQKVLPRERHAFREERRQARQKLELERAEWQRQRDAEVAQIRTQGAAVIKAAQAYQAKDWDAFAQALGAKDWNDLNGEVIGTFADPNYKKLQELERWKRDNEERARAAEEERKRVAIQQQEAQAQAEYKTALAAQMAESDDPFIAAMADDPNFVHAVFKIQEAHFDGHETISFEEAVRLKPRNGGSALLEQMRTLYSKLKRSGAFEDQDADGDRPAAKQVETGTRDAEKPAKQKAKTSISQKDASEASRPVNFSDDREFMEWGRQLLQEAADKDERERRNRRAG